jgi:Flp pilus assembly protein TadB
MRRHHVDQPLVITTARESNDDEFDRRRRRYAVMMALRAVCVLAAALTYRLSLILALVFVVGGLVLPWCAVIIANDRPPRKRQHHDGYTQGSSERALPAGDEDRTVDG